MSSAIFIWKSSGPRQSTVRNVFSCLLLTSLAYAVLGKLNQKPLTVSLDARWNHTPLHLEAAEFFAEDGADSFWKFVTDLQTLDLESFIKASEKLQYESIVELASRQLSEGRLALFKLSLALRAHSPAVETFQQIARDKKLPDCEFVLEFPGNEFTCSLDEIDRFIDKKIEGKVDIYGVDHEFGALSNGMPVVLYGDMVSTGFQKYHNALLKRYSQRKIRYILRHYVHKPVRRQVRLSGYGVEMALKSMEYKSQDDTNYKEKEVAEDETVETSEGHNDDRDIIHIMDAELTNLKESEVEELSLQLAAKILKVPPERQLKMFRDLAHNFPSIARSLTSQKIDPDLKSAVERNKKYFQAYLNLETTDTALFINGLYYDLEVSDMFVLLDSIKQETHLLEDLRDVGVETEAIPKLMKLDLNIKNSVYGVDIRDSAVQYINDIELDSDYRNWPRSLQEMLRPTYPGMLRSVRRNIFHLVIVADPAAPECRDMFKFAESFYIHRAPLRIGFVFAVNPSKDATGISNGGVALLNAFNFISQEKKPFDGLAFITEVYASQNEGYIEAERVISMFKLKFPSEDIEMVFGADSDYDTGRMLAWDFINRAGVGTPPLAMLNGISLKKENLKGDMFEEAVLTEIMKQTPKIQRAIYKGELTDRDFVIDYLMTRDNIMPRLNERVLNPPSREDTVFVDFTGRTVTDINADMMENLSAADLGASFAQTLQHLGKGTASVPLTMWIVADFDTSSGRNLLGHALEHLGNSDHTRLGFIYNNKKAATAGELTTFVESALRSLSFMETRQFLTRLVRNWDKIGSGKVKATDLLPSGTNFKLLPDDELSTIVALHQAFARTLKLKPSLRAVIVNGRLLGPLTESEDFTAEDFNLLERLSMAIYGVKLMELLDGVSSNVMMKASSVLQRFAQRKVRHEVKFATEQYGVINVSRKDKDSAAHDITVIVDPASRGAQKVSQILLLLQQVVNADIRVFFSCSYGNKELPLKTYYRFVASSEPQFGPSGELSGPRAVFVGLPSKPILTLAMATPENWLIGAVSSIYDLDNIRMADVESRVVAEFELEHLLVEGHCFEQSSGSPPRGLEFTLGSPANPVMYDTIVMANLGYFQLKANPGTWFLRIRDGRSSELYDVASTENTEKSGDDIAVLVTNFRSKVLKVRVAKRPGKEHEELLVDDDSQDDGIWNSITSSLGGGKTGEGADKEKDAEDDVINIFSVATGHLYERLLRIMMLSVLKNTNSKVKFWFLKNYLSPSMKDVLPYYARRYGFEYQLVEYKWPRWLNQQTEKQRIIWGYKILFLDVLFPLSVKKIIFVDADQIVRTDMKELRDLDLGGAPYGYTPFCDSREDMEGFRFWKRGYWSQHLGNRKYHISALYVVDLKKFRRIAAGDRLRGQYQGLSQDPNSLSNLDQDLPNNMIHQVAIKSLPQEWLWCETWCSDESKPHAKTIDLCNNPKTKEPKLAAAARIVPEWTSYDEELKKMIEEYEKEKGSGYKESTTQDSGEATLVYDGRQQQQQQPANLNGKPDLIDSQQHTEL
ncbi:UDP-glucose:glycoprotein glucosyltransferase 1-like isoform X2 [Varroa jacobsoni]|uniref:UDP-glucose:glycoprotein glucosyltransferase n=1 Tax=Varroa destructor TaxID=109461 RepID=A0A7M7JMQ8_VARDE|nr:UDP-glucose:glycoprotein glucosyltransferase 1-like isoform X2 [Varroa destructor]XP_022702407.1 UDP-glucose:glycoprotein glucosyltransferase 1-like isoform X2 [Varroa jacobsoni]